MSHASVDETSQCQSTIDSTKSTSSCDGKGLTSLEHERRLHRLLGFHSQDVKLKLNRDETQQEQCIQLVT